ncbi:hypothetical protein C5167_041480, partial [Papaver somniferum]
LHVGWGYQRAIWLFLQYQTHWNSFLVSPYSSPNSMPLPKRQRPSRAENFWFSYANSSPNSTESLSSVEGIEEGCVTCVQKFLTARFSPKENFMSKRPMLTDGGSYWNRGERRKTLILGRLHLPIRELKKVMYGEISYCQGERKGQDIRTTSPDDFDDPK